MSGPVGVLVVTHGEAGAAMLQAVCMLGTGTEGMSALSLAKGEDREAMLARISAEAIKLERGGGVLLVCDLFGSTPWNCCLEVKERLREDGITVEVLCGVNLPMLVKLASTDRSTVSLVELGRVAVETATRSVRTGERG